MKKFGKEKTGLLVLMLMTAVILAVGGCGSRKKLDFLGAEIDLDSLETAVANDSDETDEETEKETEKETQENDLLLGDLGISESEAEAESTEQAETEAGKSDAEIEKKYQEFRAPADDEIDFMFASDYEYLNLVKIQGGNDQCCYGPTLGIDKKITVADIEQVVKANSNISDKYKEFIINYTKDWLRLYPESDLRVFYYNLKTLKIEEVSEEVMMKETLSTDSAACYLRYENRILLLDSADFSRDTDNYIILTHELTHCARSVNTDLEDGTKIRINYYEDVLYGLYAEEGVITNIAYEMQGFGDRAEFYPFQSSCYRIIMDCTGYNGADFMNHGVNYLAYKMDEFMGDEDYAWYIIALIDAQATQRYTSYRNVDFDQYEDLYSYLTRMYMKKYLTADMDMEQAEQVYTDFIENITHRFASMNRPYDITADDFRPAFEQCVKDLGIS